MATRDEVLKKILQVDARCPEILLEQDGDFCLDWNNHLSISIGITGVVNWAYDDGRHGTSLIEFLAILEDYSNKV
jgi:hypothetical protein